MHKSLKISTFVTTRGGNATPAIRTKNLQKMKETSTTFKVKIWNDAFELISYRTYHNFIGTIDQLCDLVVNNLKALNMRCALIEDEQGNDIEFISIKY